MRHGNAGSADADIEIKAPVIDAVHLGRVRRNVISAVGDQGASFSDAVHSLQATSRNSASALVALVVFHHFVEAVIRGFVLVGRRHRVPRDPPARDVVQRIAQRGVMDMLFFGDTGGTPEDYGGNHQAAVRYGAKWPRHDMVPMIPLMAKAAAGVGFGITMSTTYHHPFHVARMFNALDHVTRGRIAWNAVTSAYKNEAANYGFEK